MSSDGQDVDALVTTLPADSPWGVVLPDWPRWARVVGIVIVAMGLSWVVSEYLQQRTLYSDEMLLAENFIERDGSELLANLDGQQVAAGGFLLAQDAIVATFGPSELGLRLLPLFAAMVTMPLMMLAVRLMLGPFGGLGMLALMVFGGTAVYWGTQNKPYIFDLCLALSLLVTAWWSMYRPDHIAPRLSWGILALGSIALSLPSVFWIAGTGIALLAHSAARRDGRRVLAVIAAGLPSAIAFLLYHRMVLAQAQRDSALMDFMNRFWADAFMPWPWRDPAGVAERFGKLFVNPFSLEHMAGLALALFMIGLLYLGWRRRSVVLLVMVPLLLGMLASMLQLYPLAERLALFVMPTLAIGVGAGLDALWRTGAKWGRIAAVVFVIALLAYPVLKIGRVDTLADLDPVVEAMTPRVRPGDTIYVYHGARLPFEYYRDELDRWRFEDANIVYGSRSRHDPLDYADDLSQLAGQPRVWLVFAKTDPYGTGDEGRLIRSMARRFGKQLESIRNDSTSAFLYDFTAPPVEDEPKPAVDPATP